MRKEIKINKRHFQLLEIMIALFLVAVCMIPLLRSYVDIYREQRKMNQALALDHLAYLAHARIVEELYINGSKGALLKEIVEREFMLSAIDPQMLEGTPYDFKYRLTIISPKSFEKQEQAKRLLLSLEIDPIKKEEPTKKIERSYDYKLCIERPEIKLGQNDLPQNPPARDDDGK